MADTYRIEKIGDLLLIPLDRLPAFIGELETGIEMVHFVHGSAARPELLPTITWVDDGEHSTEVRHQDGSYLRVEVRENDDGGS
ncbi:hypothetical protein [Stenotrophomonas maltophilia]|uniref:hypothetical protein n=1 Tax=Stenotrophomonas maltophilia TaxID=40324 RepID=UPI0039C2AB9A